MYQKKKLSMMLIVILLLQLIIPIMSIMVESGITLNAIASNENEYYINTAEDLWKFAEKVNGGDTFKGITVYLTADIDLECDEESQWVPIGEYDENGEKSFKGIFDGNNYSISGIYIKGRKDYQGLFGINHEGTIKNIKVKDSSINAIRYVGGIVGYNYKGNIYNCSYNGIIICGINLGSSAYGGGITGGIVGYNDQGTIERCFNEAKIDNTRAGGTQIGGIVGINNTGDVLQCYNIGKMIGTSMGGIVGDVWRGTIKQCYNYASISTSNAGGIVHYIKEGKIEECYNTGNITGTRCVGGIVAQIGPWGDEESVIVKNCYNTGKITGQERVGGIVGSNNTGVNVEISNCYNIGNVSATLNYGGISGFNLESKIKDCYYLNTTSSGAIDGIDDSINNVIPVADSEIRDSAFLTTLNKTENQWKTLKNHSYKYPVLNWQTDIILSPEINQEKYYIYTEKELWDLATVINDGENCQDKIIYLMNDIIVNSSKTKQWEEIGKSSKLAFEGTFEGNNNCISGVYTTIGLFGYIGKDGTVENLTIKNSTIEGRNVGGIASENQGTINNCTNEVNITGEFWCGGIAGRNYGIINNCKNYGNIKGDQCIGGIAGSNGGSLVGDEGKIYNCLNTGTICNTDNYVGRNNRGKQRYNKELL